MTNANIEGIKVLGQPFARSIRVASELDGSVLRHKSSSSTFTGTNFT